MGLRIGQLAGTAGVNLQTVRYYERRGLLAEPARTRSGYRCYAPEAVDRLLFIRRAKALGFTLREIQGLLDLRIDRPSPGSCERVRSATEAKVRMVDGKIRELRSLKRSLERLLAACRTRERTGECPILDAITPAGEDAEGGPPALVAQTRRRPKPGSSGERRQQVG